MFFEDAALLVDVPLLVVGAAGLLIAPGALISSWLKPY